MSTPAAPVELQPSQYGYAVRLTTVVGADEVVKDDLPFEFSAEIEGFSGARDELFVVAGEVALFRISAMKPINGRVADLPDIPWPCCPTGGIVEVGKCSGDLPTGF